MPAPLKRRPTRRVSLGTVALGGDEPIRVQSMLTSETTDVPACLAEIERLDAAGCEIIRITAPSQKSVEALGHIREGMRERGIVRPLVADIHFNPALAVAACEFVEKVRINPGNYADRKKFEVREYTDAQYAEELERIEEALQPLIRNLRRYGRALRIGTNHGSLSDRVMNRYGDSPEGMVQSAMEFLRIFRRHDYHEMVLSMKSSNPVVMMEAYRLLVQRMDEEGMDYPLHLGVTEAGFGADGRIKSAVGIGGLLADGLGDTIRVSLTEPAENEIPAALQILEEVTGSGALHQTNAEPQQSADAERSQTAAPGRVFRRSGKDLGRLHKGELTARHATRSPREITLSGVSVGGEAPFRLLALSDYVVPELPPPEGFDALISSEDPNLKLLPTSVEVSLEDASGLLLLDAAHPLSSIRTLHQDLEQQEVPAPLAVLLPRLQPGELPLGLAAELGVLIADGMIQALVCRTAAPQAPELEFARMLLQATRVRLYKADFISCPSCGRTFFDLQTTTARIKERTGHLKGVKIAVMGCVVNGPGEMADADFGYVGAGPGKVHLYRGQTQVARNIPSEQAVDRLIALLQEHQVWKDPDTTQASGD